MRDYLQKNIQMIMVLLVWVVTGMFFWQSLLLIVPATIVLFVKRNMYLELFVGFWFFLIISDSYVEQLKFAKQFKVIYLLLITFVLLAKRGVLIKVKNQIISVFLPFFFLSMVLVLWSPVPGTSFQKALSYFILFFVVPTFVNFFINKNERDFYRNLVFFAVFLLALGLVFKYIGSQWVYLGGRFSGVLGNPNGLGLFTALVFILYKVTSRMRPDAFASQEKTFILVILLWNIILSQSRTAVFMVIIYVVFVRLYRISPLIGFLVLILLTVVYQSVLFYLPTIVSFLGVEEFMRVDTIESGSGRVIAWNFAWEEIKKYNVIFGRGFGFTEYFFGINYHKLSREGHLGNAHNTYLTLWLDTGLLGLTLYIVPMLLLILKAAKKTIVAIPFFFAIIFSTNFESWLSASLNPFTIVFLVILSIVTSKTMDDKKDNIEFNAEIST